MILPDSFQRLFKNLMSSNEYEEFIGSFNAKPYEGIRYNSLKIDKDDFLSKLNNLGPAITWTEDGFYFDKSSKETRWTIHPYYHQGLFYVQEPSAMYPVEALSPTPGQKVLDLCAAPGGKSVQIAAKMSNKGLLVSNEISPKRARALKKNIELYGIKNSIITNSTGKNLLHTYGSYFDLILVDAPCSGEGTFRKDSNAVKEYDKYAGESLCETQRDILDHAFKLLRPGGKIVYSTCTFNPYENERQIEYMLSNYECRLLKLKKTDGMSEGRPEWSEKGLEQITEAVRFWPHKTSCEGHFVAGIEKLSEESIKPVNKSRNWKEFYRLDERIKNFFRENIAEDYSSYYFQNIEEEYYLMDEPYPISDRNKIQHIGIHIGSLNKYKFVPSQSFAMTLKKEELVNIIDIDYNNANRYLKGETLDISLPDGYYGVFYENNILGWAKMTTGFFKNLYEKSWRKVNDGYSTDTSDN